MQKISIGDIVETSYNSGIYLGEVLEDKRNFWLVKVLAVVEHPLQGDLHKRGQVEGVAFHERKALAKYEKMNAKKRQTQPFTGEVPNYETSLQNAIDNFRVELQAEDTAYHRASLARLADLETHFYDKILKN